MYPFSTGNLTHRVGVPSFLPAAAMEAVLGSGGGGGGGGGLRNATFALSAAAGGGGAMMTPTPAPSYGEWGSGSVVVLPVCFPMSSHFKIRALLSFSS